MLTLDQIPLNADGIVRGTYRVRHKHSFNDTAGDVTFVGNLSGPITGRSLRRLVACMGEDLVELIPEDHEARRAMGVPIAAVIEVREPTKLIEPRDLAPSETLTDAIEQVTLVDAPQPAPKKKRPAAA